MILAEVRGQAGPPGGLRGQLTAAADLFDEGTARAIADRLARVLAAVAADPRARLRQVQVLDAGGAGAAGARAGMTRRRRCRRGRWRSCSRRGRRGRRMRWRCAAGRRGSVTGSCWRGRRGWRGYLRAAGAGPETVVGLCLDRGSGAGDRDAGGVAGGGGVPAAGPGLSGRAAGVHAGRQPGGGWWSGRGGPWTGLPAGRLPVIELDDRRYRGGGGGGAPGGGAGGWRPGSWRM